MAMGTHSKVGSMSSSMTSSDPLDTNDLLEQESRLHSSSDDRPATSFQKKSNQPAFCQFSGDHSSVILQTSCGLHLSCSAVNPEPRNRNL